MAELIAVVGESGTGKTTSIRNLNPEETFIISTTGKRPGIPGGNKKYPKFKIENGTTSGNFFTSANFEQIIKVLNFIDGKMPNVKNVIIDDFQYIMGFEAMDKADQKNYDKFSLMAQHAYQVLKTGMGMRDNIFFIICTHSTNDGDKITPFYRMKTQGKMLDNVITLEGLFKYVLFSFVKTDQDSGKSVYKLMTNNDGTCTAKSPMGCFDEQFIDNDLNYVINKIKEYNGEDE